MDCQFLEMYVCDECLVKNADVVVRVVPDGGKAQVQTFVPPNPNED